MPMHVLIPYQRPNLNGAELVQARSKKYMVDERGFDTFVREVVKGYKKTKVKDMEEIYKHVIMEPFQLL
jgi:hypothetical protein